MKITQIYALAFMMIILIGCSSGGNPIIPSNRDNPLSDQYSLTDSLPYPYAITNNSIGSGFGVFGMYNIHLNPDSMTAEITPIRNADALGGLYEVDITSFLGSLCKDCVQIVGVSLTDEKFLEVIFRLHHPIPVPADPFNPKPSDRLDLHLFDVRGIVLKEGNRTFTGFKADVNGDGNIAEELRCNPTFLRNADGYTTFFDSYMDSRGVFTQANLHPYKLFFKDPRPGNYQPSVNPVNGWITLAYPQGQNVFPQGNLASNVSYVFDIPAGTSADVVMLFDACYGHSAQFSIPFPEIGSRMNPRYFLPEFHRKEAWYAFVDITNNNLAYNATSSTATVTVTVYDWQAGLTGQGPLDFQTANLNHITNTSDVEEVKVFIPEIINEPKTNYISKTGKGSFTDPYVYTFIIQNQKNASEGTYYGIVAIKDTIANTANVPPGVSRQLSPVTIKDFVNYQVFPIKVSGSGGNQPPFAMFITNPMPAIINSGEFVSFDATMSFDPDGEIVLYEWDFEFEGLDFIPDDYGAIPSPHRYFNPNSSMPAIFFALMRITDNGNPPMENMYGTEIIVMPSSPPVAVIQVQPSTRFHECDLVTLDGTQSHDDSQIISYEWDFDYNPEIPEFNVDATGPIVRKRFLPGARNVMLRVWDDTNTSGTTRVRLVADPLTGNHGEVKFCYNYILDEQDAKNSHTFAGGGQRNVVLLPNWRVVALWVDADGLGGGPDIKYAISRDGGRNFGPPMRVNSVQISGSHQNLRPTIASDSLGNIHVGYSDGDGTYYYQKSEGGEPFSDRVAVGSGSRIYGGPAITTDMAGTIYYFFTGNESAGNVPLKVATSTDGGNSFNSPVTIFADGRFIAASASNTGSVIIAYEGKNAALNDNSDIFVAYQRSGTVFYPPIRVVDSAANDGRSTNPSLAVAMSGAIYVAWQDSRLGDTDNDYDIFYAYSVSGLSFSQNIRVNNTNETSGSQIIQDYPAIGVDMMGNVYIAWRDFRDGAGGDIYFAYSTMPGSLISENKKINDDTYNPPITVQGPPNIIVSYNSGILIMWGDERNAASDLGTPFSGAADIYYTFGKLF